MELIQLKPDREVTLVPEAVLDVSSGRLMKNTALTIRQGRIANLGEPAGRGSIVSLPGIVLMPGMIDTHVHLALDGENFQAALGRWDKPHLLAEQLEKDAAGCLACGVLAVRDGGDSHCIGLKARQQLREKFGLHVAATGYALRKEGYYGSFLGPGIRQNGDGAEHIKILRELGIDQLKIIVSGIVSFQEYGRVGPVQFSLAELKALVDEAHNQGLKVMAHASSDEAVRLSALAEVDTVEHGYFISSHSLELLAEKDIAWVPTVVPVAIWTAEPWRNHRSFEELEVLEKTYRLHLERIKEADALGVKLGIGTDAGAVAVPHGYAYYRELQYFRQAGLSPLSCLKAATVQAAGIIGADHSGSISPGAEARLIGVRGNPLADLKVLEKPAYVILPEPGAS